MRFDKCDPKDAPFGKFGTISLKDMTWLVCPEETLPDTTFTRLQGCYEHALLHKKSKEVRNPSCNIPRLHHGVTKGPKSN